MAQPLIERESHPTNTFAQWYGVLGGPIWWAMQLQANYSLVPQACRVGDMKWVHISSVVFILLSLSAVAWAWLDWRKAKRTSPPNREDAEARSSTPTARRIGHGERAENFGLCVNHTLP